MTNAFTLFRTVLVYTVCLPLAIFIGYMLATPTDLTTYASVALLLGVMAVPLFLKWHYPWLILAWNSTAGLYFLPGKPTLALVMVFTSLSFSVLTFILNRNSKFISVPSITRPLVFITIVVLVTAKLTNSLGLNVLGSDTMGGKRYIYLLAALLGYFALVAERIPVQKLNLYVNLYFLGALSSAFGNLISVISPSFYFIFLIFPADTGSVENSHLGDTTVAISRLGGIAGTSTFVTALLLARFGLAGVLDVRKYWRFLTFFIFVGLSFYGGFRSKVIDLTLLCSLLFYMEGLARTRLLPVLILAGVLSATLLVPFSNKLPVPIQRSLTFLPLDLDKDAVMDAQASTEWRLAMWSRIVPQIPHYLLLGKGLGIDPHEADQLSSGLDKTSETAAGAALAGDYHSGPLSLIVPFGLAGVAGFIWYLVAALRLLYRNYKFGDPEYEHINRFLFAYFIVRIVIFLFIFGSFYGDMFLFIGPVGFSIALNGGMRKPAAEQPLPRPVLGRFKLANAAR